MKIDCECGEIIVDQTDGQRTKGHIVPDQFLFALLDAIDDAIEKSGPSASQKEAACMRVRTQFSRLARLAWQCRHCGRLYIDGLEGELQIFRPSGSGVSHEVLAGDRKPVGPT